MPGRCALCWVTTATVISVGQTQVSAEKTQPGSPQATSSVWGLSCASHSTTRHGCRALNPGETEGPQRGTSPAWPNSRPLRGCWRVQQLHHSPGHNHWGSPELPDHVGSWSKAVPTMCSSFKLSLPRGVVAGTGELQETERTNPVMEWDLLSQSLQQNG